MSNLNSCYSILWQNFLKVRTRVSVMVKFSYKVSKGDSAKRQGHYLWKVETNEKYFLFFHNTFETCQTEGSISKYILEKTVNRFKMHQSINYYNFNKSLGRQKTKKGLCSQKTGISKNKIKTAILFLSNIVTLILLDFYLKKVW